MKEIQERITALTDTYRRQLDLYNQVKEVGSQEEGLIKKGQFDELLRVLRKKQALLNDGTVLEEQLGILQEGLARHFQLEEFSIPRLKKTASTRYQKNLAALEQVVAELVPVLEKLEAQERQNEASLNEYLKQSKNLGEDHFRTLRAAKAYGSKSPGNKG